MLRRTPRDPTKPPRIFTRTAVAAILVVLVLACASRFAYALRTAVPGDGKSTASVLAEAELTSANEQGTSTAIRMRIMCRNGEYAEKTAVVSLPARSLAERAYVQEAFLLSAQDALDRSIGRRVPFPLLKNFSVGYDIEYRVKDPEGYVALAHLSAWFQSGTFSSGPFCAAITPPGPSHQVLIFPPDLVISALCGIAAGYLTSVIALMLIVNMINKSRWLDRVDAGVCVRCKYPLASVPSDVCPECGTPRTGAPRPSHTRESRGMTTNSSARRAGRK